MHLTCFLPLIGGLISHVAAQKTFEITGWQTTPDKSSLFAPVTKQSATFKTTAESASADIVIDEKTVKQTMEGFGATLTDSGAKSLSELKKKNPDSYSKLLDKLFNPGVNASSAGITYLRVPLGATDFSATSYTYDDTAGDTSFNKFNIDVAPSYVFEVLEDIQAVSSPDSLHIHLVPWSPPGWFKDSGSINGGSFKSQMAETYAQYLLKCLQAFEKKGIHIRAISIQNEVLNSNGSLPSCKMTWEDEGAIGKALRALMNSNQFTNVKLIAFEHNWSGLDYATSLMEKYSDVFDGVAVHCYRGTVDDQKQFADAHPKTNIYFTECSGMLGGDWWGDMQWQTDNLFIGSVEYRAKTVLTWLLVSGDQLPDASSCHDKQGNANSCRAVVTANPDGSYVLNEEYYAIAHASRAVIPQDKEFGKLIGSTVSKSHAGSLRVTAYSTARANAKDPTRYSLHVLNMGGTAEYTIGFQGKQVSYSFPRGLTTLWFYA
ncbi:glucan endo-1,6-beta-glucosidase [Mycena rebaudengoi]|nr:glucan endo-1,6-beta-glucosidase [Mycena rebaudengoi]